MEKMDRFFSISRKKLPWLVILFLFGVVLLSVGNLISGEEPVESPVTAQPIEKEDDSLKKRSDSGDRIAAEKEMAQKIENLLSVVKGVGQVSVTVSLENGPEYVYAVNENLTERKVEENDSGGGQRVTTETTDNDQMVFAQSASAGGQEPVIVKELQPKIAGVLVVAEGAGDPELKATLSRAVQTLLNVPAHRVSILQKNTEN